MASPTTELNDARDTCSQPVEASASSSESQPAKKTRGPTPDKQPHASDQMQE